MAMSRISAVFDADTAGLTAGTKEATAALRRLSGDISSLDAVYAKLGGFSGQAFADIGPAAGVAGAAMLSLKSGFASLEAQWNAGKVTIQQYRNGLVALGQAAEAAADLIARGVQVTQRFQSAGLQYANQVSEYYRLRQAGAITEQTYRAALQESRQEYERASGATQRAEEAERQRQAVEQQRIAVMERGRAVVQSLLTAEQQHEQTVSNLSGLLNAGAISYETYVAAAERSRVATVQASAAYRESQALRSRGDQVTEQFASPANRLVEQIGEYNRLLDAGTISEETHAAAVRAANAAYDTATGATERLNAVEREHADLLARAQTVIAATTTAEQRHAAQLANLNELISRGVIDQRQYDAAVAQSQQTLAESTGATRAAAAAQRALEQSMQQGAAVTRQVATAKEAYRSRVSELRQLLLSGAISQQTFSRAVNAAEKEMKQASAAANTYRGSASGLNSVLGKLNTVIALQATQLFVQLASAVSQAVRSIINVGAAIAKSVDSTDLLAKRTGQSVENIAALEFAGRQAGVGIEQLATATAKADRLFVQAQGGSKQAAAAFGAIGLSVQDLAGLSAEDRFNAIGDAIARLPNPAQQSAAAIAIFGRAGAGLVPMFQEMEGKLGAVRAQAEQVGFVLSGQQVEAIDRMNDSLDVAKLAFEGIIRQVTAYLAPAIQAAADVWTSFVASTGGANIGQGIVTALLDGAEVVARLFDYAVSIFRPVWDYASQVVNGLGGVANVWNGVAIVMQSVVLAFQGVLSAIGAVGSAFGAAITKLMSGLLGVAATVAEYFGKNELANTIKGMQDYTNKAAQASYDNMIALGQQSGEQFAGAVENIWNPEKYGFAMGQAAGGTFESSVEKLRARLGQQQAEAAANVKAVGDGAAAGVAAVVETKLASALDTRSKEGNKEMLRLMYGSQQQQIDQQQLNATNRIADGVDDLNDNIDNLGMEAFAF